MADIEWVIVDRFSRPIGALGFIDNKVAIIASFHDDRDGNRDGRVSLGENVVSRLSPIGMKGKAVAEVAMQARGDPSVAERDPEFRQVSAQIFVNFAANMVADGIYAAYFARGVRGASGAVAKGITDSTIKQFVIRKGMETAVKRAYESGTR